MTKEEYSKLASRTINIGITDPFLQLQNAVMGLCGESGECVDIMKKSMFQGHPLDRTHMIKELGDILWYVNLAAACLGSDFEEIMTMNIKKLEERYGSKFSEEKSINRKIGDI